MRYGEVAYFFLFSILDEDKNIGLATINLFSRADKVIQEQSSTVIQAVKIRGEGTQVVMVPATSIVQVVGISPFWRERCQLGEDTDEYFVSPKIGLNYVHVATEEDSEDEDE